MKEREIAAGHTLSVGRARGLAHSEVQETEPEPSSHSSNSFDTLTSYLAPVLAE